MAPNILGTEIDRHWREFRPRLVADLERRGVLQKAIEAAQALTRVSEAEAINAGATPDQAREKFNLWAFLQRGRRRISDAIRGLGSERPEQLRVMAGVPGAASHDGARKTRPSATPLSRASKDGSLTAATQAFPTLCSWPGGTAFD
jgi:hypothetical protein